MQRIRGPGVWDFPGANGPRSHGKARRDAYIIIFFERKEVTYGALPRAFGTRQGDSDHDKQFEEADRHFAATSEHLNSINETLAALREIERQNQELIDAMGERIDALENVPADRWNKVVDYALTCVLGIAIGFMASNIGL